MLTSIDPANAVMFLILNHELQGPQLKQGTLVPPTHLHRELHHKAPCALASERLRLPEENATLDTGSHRD